MFKAGPLEVMKKARGHYDDILEYCGSPKALLKYLDSIGVDRGVVLNYVCPETMAFSLLRRHRNVYLDISGIPHKILLQYFPRLEEIAEKTLFGTDWPSPGIPDIKQNLDQFRGLHLSDAIKEQILSKTALAVWPE